MRGRVVIVGLLLSVLMVVSASAGLQVGAKAWMIEGTFDGGGGELDTDGVMVGPTLSIDLGDSLYCSAMWLIGEEDWGGGLEYDTQEAEIVLAIAFDWFDIGIGCRYTEDELQSDGTKARRLGPMAYLGAGNSFGDSPLGWYAGAAWMFVDVDDDWDAGEHYNVEAGLSFYLDPISAAVGYRMRDHYDADNDLLYKGVTASASIAF